MKFNCGPSPDEKRASRHIAKMTRLREKAEALRGWHRVFAWWPIRIAPGECRWLEYVERRIPRATAHYSDWEGFTIVWNGKPEFRASA
ncbi:MAG: hypothetical protein AB7I36_08460 [Rhodospirillaceae bacterium]